MFINSETLLLPSRPYDCPECGENGQNNQPTCQRYYFCQVVLSVQGTFNVLNNGTNCTKLYMILICY